MINAGGLIDVLNANEPEKIYSRFTRSKKQVVIGRLFLERQAIISRLKTSVVRPWPESGIPIAWQKEIGEGLGGRICFARSFIFL